jgi:signal recognition particle subunit SRP54
MFEGITRSLGEAFKKLRGRGRLTPDNIREGLREVRRSFLEADVNFNVVSDFIKRVEEKSVGQDVLARVDPSEQIIKIVYEELVGLMGPVEHKIPQRSDRPVVLMLCGLQGSGKTTTAAKLALTLRERGRKPMLAAADLQRPGAVEQLQTLGEQIGVPVYSEKTNPVDVCRNAVAQAKRTLMDTVILDTAGRLHVDDDLMAELRQIEKKVKPHQVYFVCDALTGQDAVASADAFNKALELDGVIMTKLDGDARGGAALSVKEITGKPIKFLGMGESLDKLEEFRPEGLASRILGMGDIVGLVKDFEQVVDAEKAEEDALRMLKGKFDMQDFLEQIRLIQKMGSLKDLFEKLPFFNGGLPEGVNLDDRELTKIEAMISSMTREERLNPQVFVATTWEEFMATSGRQAKRRRADFNPSRVKRVSKGSGRTENEVKELLQKFAQMRQMMVQLGASTGLMGKIPGFKQFSQMKKLAGMDINSLMAGGGMPPGFGDGGGMPNMPQMPGVPTGNVPGLPKGYNPPGSKGVVGQPRPVDKQKSRDKRKAEKAARKKNRR